MSQLSCNGENKINLNTIVTESNAQDTRIGDLEAPTEAVVFEDMTGNEPETTEGQVYRANGALNFQGEFPEQLTQLSEELPITVANSTGQLIKNGDPLIYAGVSNGEPMVAFAKADSLVNAKGIAVATMDIPIGGRGKAVFYGRVKGLDLSAFANGDVLYLGNTGGYTTLAPDIITSVGMVFNNSATDGVLFVRPEENIVLPTIYVSIKEATSPTSLPTGLGTSTIVSGYTTENKLGMTANLSTGSLLCGYTGVYRANLSFDLAFDNVGGAGKKEIYLDVRDVTSNTVLSSTKGFILKDAETYSFSGNSVVNLVDGGEYRVEFRSEIALANLTFTQSNFDFASMHIRRLS